MLSSNQAELLRRIIDAGRPVPISEVAEWKLGGANHEFGENAARNALKRMEDRELVTGSGAGRARSYAATRIGTSALAEHAGAAPPPAQGQDSGSETATRNYIVLEQIPLGDFDAWLEAQQERGVASLEPQEVFVKVATVDARNTEHAIRQAATIAYDDMEADPVLIPVADRMWQPVEVRIRNKRSISIGA